MEGSGCTTECKTCPVPKCGDGHVDAGEEVSSYGWTFTEFDSNEELSVISDQRTASRALGVPLNARPAQYLNAAMVT